MGLRGASSASKVQLEPHILKEKVLQMKTRQSLTLSGPKNVGIKSKVVRTRETMLLNSTRRSETLSGQESTGVESEVFRTEEKVAARRTRRLRNLSRQESAELEPKVFRTKEKLLQKKHTQKISDLAFYVTLCSQLWSKGRANKCSRNTNVSTNESMSSRELN